MTDSKVIVDDGDIIFQNNASLSLQRSSLYLLSGYVIFADQSTLVSDGSNVNVLGGDLVFVDEAEMNFVQNSASGKLQMSLPNGI